MKIKFPLFFLIAIFTINSFGQQPGSSVKLILSQEMKEPAGSTIDNYLGEDESNIFVLRRKVKTSAYTIESYDKGLKLKIQQEIEPVIGGDKTDLDLVKFLDGNLYAFIVLLNKKADQTELYYQGIDKKNLLLSGKPVKISSIPYQSRFKQGSFSYKVSKDKKMIAVISSRHDQKDIKERFSVSVFDATMKLIWKKEITLPYDSKLFEETNLLLDNKGNLYISGMLFKDVAKEKRKGIANYSYKILSYRDGGASSKEYNVTLKDEFITDLGFNITNDDKLAVAGFYSSEGTTSIKGICFTLIDAASDVVIRQGKKSFDAEFLTLFSRGDIDKKDQEIYNYDLDNIIIRSDGGVLLLAEQYYVKESTTPYVVNGMTQYRTTYYYHYNDVIAVNVNPDMTIAWATKVPKRQLTVDDHGYYSSYAYAVTGGKVYLLFNDNPDNLAVTDPSKVAKYTSVNRSVATLVTINQDGKWEKSMLFNNREQGQILRPKICRQVMENQFFLYAERGKNYVIGKLEL